MIVDSLLWKGNSQGSLLITSFLDLSSLILEPNFQLSLIETKLRTKILPSLLCQVLVGKELLLETLQLLLIERGSWLLFQRALLIVLRFPLSLSSCSSSWGSIWISCCKNPCWDVGEVAQSFGWHIWGVCGVGQVHWKLCLDDSFEWRGHGRCWRRDWRGWWLMTSEVRTKNVFNGEWKVGAGAGIMRGEWVIRVRRSTASLAWFNKTFSGSLPLLKLVITNECVHGE